MYLTSPEGQDRTCEASVLVRHLQSDTAPSMATLILYDDRRMGAYTFR